MFISAQETQSAPVLSRLAFGAERRRTVRYHVLETSASLLALVDDDSSLCRVRNISAGGISLVTSRGIEPESMVQLELFNRIRQYYARVTLRVLYVVEHPDNDFILGGSFTRVLTPEEIAGLL
jgi:hypothetical protein